MSSTQKSEVELQPTNPSPKNTNNEKNQPKNLSPKELMKPLLESISPIALCLIYIGFLVFVGIALALSTVAPPMYVTQSLGTWNCENKTLNTFDSLNCTGVNLMRNAMIKGPLGEYKIQPFSILNREFALNGKFKNVLEFGYFKKQIYVQVGIYSPAVDGKGGNVVVEEVSKDFYVECFGGEEYCSVMQIYAESFTNNEEYIVNLQFISSKFNETEVGEFVLDLSAVSSHFTLFELIWKFLFIFYSCLITFIYLFIFRKFPFKTWLFEVKWTFVLLIILVIHNNPIYSYEYTLETFIPEFFNVSVYSLFYVFLLFYILITFEFYKNGKGTKRLIYWVPRVIFFMFLFSAVNLVFIYNKSVGLSDPYYNPLKDVASLVMAAIAIIFVIAYIFWLIYVLIRSFSDGAKLGKTKRKLRLFGALTLVSMFLFFMLLALSFFFGYQQTLSISLTTTAYVNFFCTLLVIINIPHQGEESEIWTQERLKITAVDDLAVYKQLPDDAVSELQYNSSDEEEETNQNTDSRQNQSARTNQNNGGVLFDGSEAIEL